MSPLEGLVPVEGRPEANSRFEQTNWITLSVGPAIGGALVGLVGATATLAVDAVSFLLSALGVRRIQQPEPAPVRRDGKRTSPPGGDTSCVIADCGHCSGTRNCSAGR